MSSLNVPNTDPLPNATVIVADAHLGHARGVNSDAAFLTFLQRVPTLGNHLILNGDIFEFWFEYRSVIPTTAFGTLAALAAIRKAGVRVTVTGGNHDRWGKAFWKDHLDATFLRDGGMVDVGTWQALVRHGDGLTEYHWGARLLHGITRNRLTEALFRLLHPDLGLYMVRTMSFVVGEGSRSEAMVGRAAAEQQRWALQFLDAHPTTKLLVMAHTHRAALQETSHGQWYLNSGAWMEDQCYAIVTADGPTLCRFEP